MEEGMAGVIQECFAKNCDEAAVGDPALFCEKHEKMIPEKGILWLRENHFDLYKKPSRKWIAMMSRAVAKIMMEENKNGKE